MDYDSESATVAFGDPTTLGFDLPASAAVSLRVYDVLGREVARVVDGTLEAGSHRAVWDARDVASGTYIVHFRADDFVASQRITVMK